MSGFLSWAKFIIGLIFLPEARRRTAKALEEWATAPAPRAPAPQVDPDWLAKRSEWLLRQAAAAGYSRD